MKPAAVIEALVARLGPSHVFTHPGDVTARAHDGRGPAGQALALVRPGTAAEVSEIVRPAAEAGLRLVPAGAPYRLVASRRSGESGSVLFVSAERLGGPPGGRRKAR